MTNIANATQGVYETYEGLQKSFFIAECFFGAFVVGMAANYAFFASSVVMGVGVVGALASATYGYYTYTEIAPVEFWQTGFEMLYKGDGNQAIDHFKFALIENYASVEESTNLFREKAKAGFYYLDSRDKTAGSNSMIVSVFGGLLLHHAVHAMKTNDELSDEEYTVLQSDIKVAQKLFQAQRCGIRKDQEAVCDFFSKTKAEAKAAIESAKIPVPQQFSIGHGMLLSIYDWLKDSEHRLKEDGSMDGGGAGLEHLDSWQATAEKAKVWLAKSGHYKEGSIEKKVVDSMLAATNMRELMDVILGDFKTNLAHFKSQAASTA